jgi:hypothetical protein
MILIQVPETLATAMRSYLQSFGHPVPDEVVEMFAARPGPLLMEIRQAIAATPRQGVADPVHVRSDDGRRIPALLGPS